MCKIIIGIDYGKSRIGVASGQILTKTASPIATISAKNGVPDWQKFDQLVHQWHPHEIVIGLPIDTKDQETEITKEVRLFSKVIEKRYQKKIHLISEAFSTQEALWLLKKANQKVNSFLKVDALAACIILETWMNLSHTACV